MCMCTQCLGSDFGGSHVLQLSVLSLPLKSFAGLGGWLCSYLNKVPKMRRLSSHCRTLIMKLAARGFGVSRIRNEIKQVLGIKATRLTIRKWMKRYKESGSSNDLPRYHLPPKLGPAHLQFIERCMQENSELTAMELQA